VRSAPATDLAPLVGRHRSVAPDLPREPFDVTRRDEWDEPGVFAELPVGRDVGQDDRASGSHRLKDRHRQTLTVRGGDEDVGFGTRDEHLFAGDEASQRDAVPKA